MPQYGTSSKRWRLHGMPTICATLGVKLCNAWKVNGMKTKAMLSVCCRSSYENKAKTLYHLKAALGTPRTDSSLTRHYITELRVIATAKLTKDRHFFRVHYFWMNCTSLLVQSRPFIPLNIRYNLVDRKLIELSTKDRIRALVNHFLQQFQTLFLHTFTSVWQLTQNHLTESLAGVTL